MSALIVIWMPLVGAVAYFIYVFNRLVAGRNACANARASIDVNLKRRHQLIPNLVETVRGYAAHEHTTLARVSQARAEAVTQLGTSHSATAEALVDKSLTRLAVKVEAYPELNASEVFTNLMKNLTEAEEQISASRRAFNGQVMDLNNLIQQFPSLLVAKLLQYTPLTPYAADANAKDAPTVSIANG